MDSKEELFKISEEIRRCTACPLWKGRTLTVPGDGDSNARIMFVGEGPGAEEDRQGLPFVGRAGKEVFITNTVKCRPPGNRDPKEEEARICKKWLDKQISIIDPELIVVLGRIALKRLLDKDKIGELRGKTVEKKYFSDGKFVSKKYFITYHPSAGIRSPQKMGSLIEKDFKRLKQFKKDNV